GVARVGEGGAEGHVPDRRGRVVVVVLEAAAVDGDRVRARDDVAGGQARAEEGEGGDHLERRPGGVLARGGGVEPAAARSVGGGEHRAGRRAQRHDRTRRG